jgi:methyl-accepting chemotaxis protein
MKAVAEGNLTVRATIRKNDYLWKDADLINKMITSLSARIKNIEDQYSHLNAILAEVKRATNNGSAKEMNRHIEHLRVQMEELKVHLNQFKIPAEGMGEESHPGGKVVSKSTAAGSATTTRLKEGPRREVIT